MKQYDWERFWSKSGADVLLDDSGYLLDPASAAGKYHEPAVFPLEHFADQRCLVLLGEPGIGKSVEAKKEFERVRARATGGPDTCLYFNLAAYGSEDRLVRELFESSSIKSWVGGSSTCYLVLDSLDECLLRVDTLATILIEKLSVLPTVRMCLRVACRTAELPGGFLTQLHDLFSASSTAAIELAPLRKLDIETAASISGVDAKAFTAKVESIEVVPLATKPITLEMLINRFQSTGGLPDSRDRLYEEGLTLLCDEPKHLPPGGRSSRLTADQRLAVAGRVAAGCAFGAKAGVWIGSNTGDVAPEYTTLVELAGGSEPTRRDRLSVAEKDVVEALQSGLFTARGTGAMGFAHQTYLEYLAARFVSVNDLTTSQIVSLICHPTEDQLVIPQLHGVAARVAAMIPEVFEFISKRDPGVLLQADASLLSNDQKAVLTDSLLGEYARGGLQQMGWEFEQLLARLKHPTIGLQVGPLIGDRSRGDRERRAAIQIAGFCRVTEAGRALASIARDPSEGQDLRNAAVAALDLCGDGAVLRDLRPLALAPVPEDVDDELKGHVLNALWVRRLIDVREMTGALTTPKQVNLFGAYKMFLYYTLPQRLEPGDLVPLLEWAAKQPQESLTPFDGLYDALIEAAVRSLDTPEVASALATLAVARAVEHEPLFSGFRGREGAALLYENAHKRRALVHEVVGQMKHPSDDYLWVFIPGPSLLDSRDLDWLIEELDRADLASARTALALLITRVGDWREASHITNALLAAERHAELRSALTPYVAPIDLASPRATELRAQQRQFEEWETQAQSKPMLTPPPAERVEMLLRQAESGDVTAWWRLNRELTLTDTSTHYGSDFDSRIRETPGWKVSDQSTRGRILAAARQCILEHDPQTDAWLGTNTFHRPAAAGYRAFVLLSEEAPDFVESLSPAVWNRWAAIVVAFPQQGEERTDPVRMRLVKAAYKNAPAETLRALVAIIDHENREHGHVFIAETFRPIWDKGIADVLTARVATGDLKGDATRSLLALLLRMGSGAAETLARDFVLKRESRRDLALAAAWALAFYSPDGAWDLLWAAMQADRQFGSDLAMDLADRHAGEGRSILGKIPAAQLADLFVWLEQVFPRSQDPQHNTLTAHVVTPRDTVGHWRDSISSILVERGTREAYDALAVLAAKLPQLSWLSALVARARTRMLQDTWQPPTVADILLLAASRELVLVRSDEELMRVVMVVLEDMDVDLHGANTPVQFLWDGNRPKNELAFSDWTSRFLTERLSRRAIVANREVQIRKGQFTDILVSATAKGADAGSYEILQLIIEAKGSWHPDVSKAMETQLVGRYLHEHQCQHGIYLVGLFTCDKWDDGDSRKRRALKGTVVEEQAVLDQQAKKLSVGGINVRAKVVDCALR